MRQCVNVRQVLRFSRKVRRAAAKIARSSLASCSAASSSLALTGHLAGIAPGVVASRARTALAISSHSTDSSASSAGQCNRHTQCRNREARAMRPQGRELMPVLSRVAGSQNLRSRSRPRICIFCHSPIAPLPHCLISQNSVSKCREPEDSTMRGIAASLHPGPAATGSGPPAGVGCFRLTWAPRASRPHESRRAGDSPSEESGSRTTSCRRRTGDTRG